MLILSTGFIFSFSLLGDTMFQRVFAEKDTFAENTSIGTLDVSLLDSDEALTKLVEEQSRWGDETTIQLQYKEKTIDFYLNQFQFLLEDTIVDAQPGVKNELLVELDDDVIHAILSDFKIDREIMDTETLKKQLLSYPAMLETGSHVIKLQDFMLKEPEQTLISESSVTFQEDSEQMDLWLSDFSTITIPPYSDFSMLQLIEEKGVKSFTTEGLSKIATAIYRTILPTNFSIIERNISRELPSYAELGYEAKVDEKQNMDFFIYNPTDYEYTLEFIKSDNQLNVSLKGPSFFYEYPIVLADQKSFKPKMILQYDASLPVDPPQEKVKRQGKDGLIIKVYRQTVEDGAVLTEELISEDYYPPVHMIVTTSLKADIEKAEEKQEEEESDVEEEETDIEDEETEGTNETGADDPKGDNKKSDGTDQQEKTDIDEEIKDEKSPANEKKLDDEKTPTDEKKTDDEKTNETK